MDLCSGVLTDPGFNVDPGFSSSHPTSPVVTSPTMDGGYPWYSNIQTLWARKNVEMTKDKPFKRWFEVDEGSTEQDPEVTVATTQSPQQPQPSPSNLQSESLETTLSNQQNGRLVTNGDSKGTSEMETEETKEPGEVSSSGDVPLEELMQRGDTAVIFPEPVEPLTDNDEGHNNNNNEKDTESSSSSEQNSAEKSVTGLLLQCQCCHLLCKTVSTLKEHMVVAHGTPPHPHPYPHGAPNPATNSTLSPPQAQPVTGETVESSQNPVESSQQDPVQRQLAVVPKTERDTSSLLLASCPQCGATFQEADELEKHINLHCPVVQECKICQKTFANVYRLQRHMLTHEESTELRKFKCPECAKAFKFKHHLKEHIRIHSGEKPFECSNCGKRFSHSGSYSSHMTSKKCWVGSSASPAAVTTPTIKMRSKMAAVAPIDPPHPAEVLRPLVAKGDENGMDGVLGGPVTTAAAAAFMYQQSSLVDPTLLQYTLAMRHGPYLPYALNQLAMNNLHQQFLGATGKNPVAALPLPPLVKGMEKGEGDSSDKVGSGDEKENKEEVKEEPMEQIAAEPGEKLTMEDSEIEKEKEETIKKVLEMVEATASSQQQQSKLNTLASVSSQELHQLQNHCRFCTSVFGSPIELHQHERYQCPQAQQHDTASNHSDDGSSTQGCRVRSILSDEQKRHLEAQYAETPWPAKHDMERLAADTGLARRVIQVWFQNCRARDRRKGKSIPERPVGLRTPPDSYSRPAAVPEPSRPYIPRVPQIQRSFFLPPQTSGIQIEPLDLSNKPGQGASHALNLSTKAPTPPPMIFPFQPESSPQMEVNTTPAHSTPRTTPERPPASSPPAVRLAPSPVVVAPTLVPRAPTPVTATAAAASVTPPPPRTSTPVLHHRSSPAVFPTMVPSPTPPPPGHSDVVSEDGAVLSSMESSFGSSAAADDKNERRRSWRQMDSDGEDDAENSKRKRKSWKSHRVESMEGMYTCDQCDKLFSKQSSLARHKYEHSGQRPFPCDVCQKAFKHKHHLTEHKRLHSGEKPFECSKCGKRFSHSGSYSQHMNHRYKYCKPDAPNTDGTATGENSPMPLPHPEGSDSETSVSIPTTLSS